MSQGSKTTRRPTESIRKMLGMDPHNNDDPQEHLRSQLSRLGEAALQNPLIQAAASDLSHNRPERMQSLMDKADALFQRFTHLTEHLGLTHITADDLRKREHDRPAMRY